MSTRWTRWEMLAVHGILVRTHTHTHTHACTHARTHTHTRVGLVYHTDMQTNLTSIHQSACCCVFLPSCEASSSCIHGVLTVSACLTAPVRCWLYPPACCMFLAGYYLLSHQTGLRQCGALPEHARRR